MCMGQIALYIRDDLEKRLDSAAKREGKSRSAWVADAVAERLDKRSSFPESFFDVFGSWEDTRSAAGIIDDIDQGVTMDSRGVVR